MTEQGSQQESLPPKMEKKPKPEKPPKPEKKKAPPRKGPPDIDEDAPKAVKKKRPKICNVCFQIAGTPVPDPGYDMLHCETCDLTVHRRCIGEDVPFTEIRPAKGASIKLFQC